MAILTPLGQSKKFVNIIGGKLLTKAKEGEGIERTKKDGSKTWEHQHKDITGKIKSVEVKDTDFGTQLMITFDDDLILNTGIESKYASSFLTKLSKIDFNHEVVFSVYDFEGKNKDGNLQRFIGVVVKQNGIKIESDWDGVPPLIEKKKAGKTVYDNTDRVNYFVELVNKKPAVKEIEESEDMFF